MEKKYEFCIDTITFSDEDIAQKVWNKQIGWRFIKVEFDSEGEYLQAITEFIDEYNRLCAEEMRS